MKIFFQRISNGPAKDVNIPRHEAGIVAGLADGDSLGRHLLSGLLQHS
jgi:hypothetical protein